MRVIPHICLRIAFAGKIGTSGRYVGSSGKISHLVSFLKTIIGPILAVRSFEQPPNLTTWCGLVPSHSDEDGSVVVILGLNFHVSIPRTPPGSDKAQRPMVVAGLEAEREHTTLTNIEDRIL